MAASNYSVNIKLNTKPATNELQKLEARINKLRTNLNSPLKIDTRVSKINKEIAKSKDAQKASMIETRNIGNQIQKAADQGLKVDKARAAIRRAAVLDSKNQLKSAATQRKLALDELNIERKNTEQQAKQLELQRKQLETAGARNAAFRGGGTAAASTGRGGRSGVLSGALISGAFPLLFGQGPLAAAGGFGGGLLGGRFGGQMGGFAGGLIGTSVVTGIQGLATNMSELGSALDPANANIDKSIEKLKIINSSRAAEIKLIEQLEGKQAALAEITKDTAKVIGNDGVRALREFSETMKLFAGGLNETFLKIQTSIANIANRVFSFTGTDLSKAKANLGPDDPLIIALERNLTAQANLDRNVDPNDPFSGSFLMTPEGKKQGKALSNEQKRLEMAIKVRSVKEAGARLDKEIGVDHKNLVKSIEAQFGLENRILELRRDGLNPALAKQIALVEKSSENVKTGIQNELDSVNKLIEAERASGKGYTDKLMFLELTKLSLEDQLKTTKDLSKAEKERIVNASRLARAAKATQDSFDALKQTVATDLADGIQGLIRGTSTLGDVLNNVLDKMIDAAFNMAFFGNAGGSLIPGSGLFGALFRANGGPVKGGNSYVVGERGPEMFVPNTGGRIVPNSDMGGSTNVVVNVDASGSAVEGDEAQGRELGRLISVAVQSEIIQQQRAGGLLA